MSKIPLMKYTFVNEGQTKKALVDFIASASHLSMGVMCEDFENRFAKWQDRKEAVLFNSGGSCNVAILQALKNMGKLHVGDRIGFSSLTWSTNVMPIIQLGLVPVAMDVCVETINVMSNNLLERLEQADMKAFFITNTLGFAGDLDNIKKICNERGIILLEDNCESLGCELAENKAGNFSLMSSFSFFVSHHMSTIEGGMVCTDDEELADMLRIVRANGWARNISKDKQQKLYEEFDIDQFKAAYSFFDLGYNFRPTEITGFLGCEQLKYLNENLKKRNENYSFVEQSIKTNKDLVAVEHSHLKFATPFAMVVICRDKTLRDRYIEKFIKADIEIRPLIAGNIQRQPFYKKYVDQMFTLTGSDTLDDQGFYCGNYPELEKNELEIIANCLSK